MVGEGFYRLLRDSKCSVGYLLLLSFRSPQIVESGWWCLAFRWDLFRYFSEDDRWVMSVTMVFGALVAGMTSEGGGAVAFPVMTLALGVDPTIARDFR